MGVILYGVYGESTGLFIVNQRRGPVDFIEFVEYSYLSN